ncbi:MAG TPA: lipid-A-disaccharide synthase [Gammaproteobacteria bacterium]|nr:lipid-A-disaccharide synthase [Gammaproteobacteria bacterium]
MQICVAAGEVSGDQILAPILSRVSELAPVVFSGIGGPQMIKAGMYPLFPMDHLSVMGIMEVVPRLPKLLSIRQQMRHYLEALQPRALVTCDAPDFNLSLCAFAKSLGVPAIHVVSPSVWAWRQSRIPKIARQVDLLLCVFPFEPALYKGTSLRCEFIGHPLTTQISFNPDPVVSATALNLPANGLILGMLPGSRESEVKRLLPLFLSVFDRLVAEDKDLVGVIPAASGNLYELIQSMVGLRPMRVVHGKSREVIAASKAVLVASGTAALESVLTGRPTVAAYKMHPWTYRLVKSKVQTKFVTLPNFLSNQALIPELIQENASIESIVHAILPMLKESPANQFLTEAQKIYDSLGGDVSGRAAEAILEQLS